MTRLGEMSPERHQNKNQSLIPGTIALDWFAVRGGMDVARLLLKEGV